MDEKTQTSPSRIFRIGDAPVQFGFPSGAGAVINDPASNDLPPAEEGSGVLEPALLSPRGAGFVDSTIVRALLAGRSWALRPEAMEALAAGFSSGAPLAYMPEDDNEEPTPAKAGSVAIVSLTGMITAGSSGLMGLLFGGSGGLKVFKSQLAQVAADEDVGHIVLNIDSPGGLTDLVPETAAFVRDVAERKPVTAVANTMAASAAYWIAAQANEVVVTPSGEIGSIGVYMMHVDASKALDRIGEKVTLISAGKYKTEGNIYEPLDSDARKAFQSDVNTIYGMFVEDVAKGRNVSSSEVRNGYGEGRALLAEHAVGAGLADRVATLEEVVQGAADSFSAEEAGTPVAAEKVGAEDAEMAETSLMIELGRI